jgi:hypothetical protein
MSVTIQLLCIIVSEERRLDCSASVEILKTDGFYNPCMQVEGKELSPNSLTCWRTRSFMPGFRHMDESQQR